MQTVMILTCASTEEHGRGQKNKGRHPQVEDIPLFTFPFTHSPIHSFLQCFIGTRSCFSLTGRKKLRVYGNGDTFQDSKRQGRHQQGTEWGEQQFAEKEPWWNRLYEGRVEDTLLQTFYGLMLSTIWIKQSNLSLFGFHDHRALVWIFCLSEDKTTLFLLSQFTHLLLAGLVKIHCWWSTLWVCRELRQ